jgi:hypothetical protein
MGRSERPGTDRSLRRAFHLCNTLPCVVRAIHVSEMAGPPECLKSVHDRNSVFLTQENFIFIEVAEKIILPLGENSLGRSCQIPFFRQS